MFPAHVLRRVALLATLAALASPSPVFGFNQSGTTFTTLGTQADVAAAIAAASDGCLIKIPAGTFTWGAGNTPLFINKAVVLAGAGPGNTIINLDPTAPSGTSGTIQIFAAATVKGFTINAVGSTVAFSTSTTSGWRITNITYVAGCGISAATNTSPVQLTLTTPVPPLTNGQNVNLSGIPTAQSSYAVTVIDSTHITLNGSTGFVTFVGSPPQPQPAPSLVYSGNGSLGLDTSYFCFVDQGYGLIDNCFIYGGGGTDELIFVRGPLNSWQTPNSLGGASNTFIEDCTFGGPGYVCDANANARVVVRFCTIGGQMKVDGHGFASNSPRGIREIEVYNNHWTYNASGAFSEMELRGGTGMVFNNVSDMAPPGLAWLQLTDYGYQAQWPNFSNAFQNPLNYPITDQIGVGEDPKAAASEPMYLWNNLQNGSKWPRAIKNVAAGAVTLFQQQVGIPTASFLETDIIKADRDIYTDQSVTGTFTGSTGVGVGLFATMSAITPPATNSVPTFPDGHGAQSGGAANPNQVGFWVTDQGNWNSKQLSPNSSGQLYTWVASHGWVLKYVPYTYPHPQRAPIAPSNLRISTP